MYTNNVPLLPGFIFIPDASNIPPAYRAMRQTEVGFFAKLDTDSANGWVAISASEYEVYFRQG